MSGAAKSITALYLYASTGKKRGLREGELGPEEVLALRPAFASGVVSQLGAPAAAHSRKRNRVRRKPRTSRER